MERLTDEVQIGPFAALKDKAEAVPGAFGTYDCFYAHGVAVTRLKQYEDTGMEPEEVLKGKELAEIACAMNLLKEYQGFGSIDHFRELAQAEKDGRLWLLAVVPQGRPGGRGNRVYVIENGEIYDDYVVGVHIGVSSNGELRCLYEAYEGSDFYSADIGKTVFLTREKAEEALKKREEADNETD